MSKLNTLIKLKEDEKYEFINDFKDIKNNQYIITSYGNIYNNIIGNQLNPGIKNGYPVIHLMTNKGKSIPIRVHILVYKFFSGDKTYNPLNIQKQIHHINNDLNYEKYNHIDNLKLLTKSEIHKIPYNKKK